MWVSILIGIVLVVAYIGIFSLCRISAQADERAEKMRISGAEESQMRDVRRES